MQFNKKSIDTMKQRQCRVTGGATCSNLLLVGLLVPVLSTAQVVDEKTESSAKEKPATKANFGPTQSVEFTMTVKDNLISLKAKDASLIEVLEEIGRRMNIEVLALLPEQEKITTEFEKLPLEEAIKRLSENHSHLIVSQEDRRITKIIVLQKGVNTAASKPVIKEPETRKKEETAVKLESRTREQVIRKESPSTKPFSFQFDPSQYDKKRN